MTSQKNSFTNEKNMGVRAAPFFEHRSKRQRVRLSKRTIWHWSNAIRTRFCNILWQKWIYYTNKLGPIGSPLNGCYPVSARGKPKRTKTQKSPIRNVAKSFSQYFLEYAWNSNRTLQNTKLTKLIILACIFWSIRFWHQS